MLWDVVGNLMIQVWSAHVNLMCWSIGLTSFRIFEMTEATRRRWNRDSMWQYINHWFCYIVIVVVVAVVVVAVVVWSDPYCCCLIRSLSVGQIPLRELWGGFEIGQHVFDDKGWYLLCRHGSGWVASQIKLAMAEEGFFRVWRVNEGGSVMQCSIYYIHGLMCTPVAVKYVKSFI